MCYYLLKFSVRGGLHGRENKASNSGISHISTFRIRAPLVTKIVSLSLELFCEITAGGLQIAAGSLRLLPDGFFFLLPTQSLHSRNYAKQVHRKNSISGYGTEPRGLQVLIAKHKQM